MTELSRSDVRILETLQADARLTNVELAERVGLSPSPCLRRVWRRVWPWNPQLVTIWVVVHPDPASLRKLWQARWKVHSISALTLPRSRS